VAPGREVVVILTGGGAILIDRFTLALWAGELESVTVAVKLEVPVAVGLPEITPELLRLSPAGRLPPVTAQL
jgi:hypothetical protein